MKKTLLVLVVVIAVGAIFFLRRPPASPEAARSGSPVPPIAPATTTASIPAPRPPPPAPPAPKRPQLETVAATNGAESEDVVHVRPEQVLATVNGTAITLKDLAGFPKMQAGADQKISHHMYDSLLSRAIDRELAFQAAHAQGVDLTAEQKEQLAHMRAENEQSSATVIDLTMSPERMELDLRDAEGRMLLTDLATKSGVPSPYVTPDQVQAYYTAHKAEFGELPSDPAEAQGAQRKIDTQIRQKLAGDTTAMYQKGVDNLMNQLKASAKIDVTAPEPMGSN